MTTIYHGTPMTPRAALESVCAGRAMCVSFYRPDDVEAVEAISPAIMFRQRRVFILAGGAPARRGMGRASRLDALLRMAGTAPVSSGPVGDHSRYAGSAEPAQRCAPERMAVRTEGRSAVAHGRPARAPRAAVRVLWARLSRVDGSEGWRACLPRPNGRGCGVSRQPLAGAAHDARDGGCVRLSLRQRGLDFSRTERVAL